MAGKIATIINYCSNDYPFLKDCLDQAKKFSEKIIVVSADHLFNGQKENVEEMKKYFSNFAFATFIIYPFIPEKIPKRIQRKVKKNSMWHSISRMTGTFFLEKDIDYVLFLDIDEIVDGERFKQWLNEKNFLKYTALRPANYWYFRSVSSQAVIWEDTAVLARKKNIKRKALLDSSERDAIFNSAAGNKIRNVLGADNLPMIHHYSWVKTKEQMLTKVKTWGHKNDKNWNELIEKEFQKEESLKDFVHGYDLIKVNPFANINIMQTPAIGENKSIYPNNIISISEKALLNIIMKRSIKDFIWCHLEKTINLIKNHF